jgi:hypothetical protein
MKDAAEIFEDHYQRWKSFCQSEAVRLESSDEAYINNAHFEAMVDMGEEAVPGMIEKLRSDEAAHFLVRALERITNKRFTQEEIEAARSRYGAPLGNQGYAAMWVDWWDRQRGGK